MKLLLILSLLCINNASVPPDTAKKTAQKKQPTQEQAQKQSPPATKPVSKKAAKTPMPFFPSPLLVDLL